MLVRVRDFGAVHRAQFPESTRGGQAFAAVAAAVTQLREHSASKMSTAGEGRTAKNVARQALLDKLEAVGRTARAIGGDIPGFEDPFRLPRQRQTDQTLLTAGRVFVHDAEGAKQEFVAHGMPPDFPADVTALVDRFEESITRRETLRGTQAAAQAGTAAALLAGLAAVRKLDVIVANQLGSDPVALGQWERARRVVHQRSRGSRAAAHTAAAAGPAAPSLEPVATAPAAAAAPAAEGPEASGSGANGAPVMGVTGNGDGPMPAAVPVREAAVPASPALPVPLKVAS
jgi:hypothetical protein